MVTKAEIQELNAKSHEARELADIRDDELSSAIEEYWLEELGLEKGVTIISADAVDYIFQGFDLTWKIDVEKVPRVLGRKLSPGKATLHDWIVKDAS